MKMFLLFLLLTPHITNCQPVPGDNDPHKMEIEKNIFRELLTLSIDGSLAVTGCYEHEIYRPFTVVVKAGPSFGREEILNNIWGNEQYRFTLSGVASCELRYYYNLGRRIRLEKTTRNFSAGYLSLEPFVVSKSIILINKAEAETKPSHAGVYINIGLQKQINRTYFNAFFGTRFGGKIYETSVTVFDIIHGGATIGRVF
ncbi:MAG: hypothetical protein ABI760_06640 [Ferruginibacter sp.]